MSSLTDKARTLNGVKGKEYWRSLDELADTAEFRDAMKREFPAVATEALSPSTRRDFLKVMGASLALAGLTLTGCRMPVEKIAPYAYRAPGTSPGKTKQFATAFDLGGAPQGVLVTSFDGRPIKVEGNPTHPDSLGGCSAFAQASVLSLYDPDRSKSPASINNGNASAATWQDFLNFCGPLFAGLDNNGGKGFRVLSSLTSSPTLARLKNELGAKFPQAKWIEYDPSELGYDLLGSEIAFGKAYRHSIHPEQADVILSLDSDFLVNHPTAVRNAREFAKGRKGNGGKMNRLYMAESTYTVTGANADHRLALKSSDVAALAASIAAELINMTGVPHGAMGVSSALMSLKGFPVGAEFAKQVANDLAGNMGRSLVVAGPGQPPVVHALSHLMNLALQNENRSIKYYETGEIALDRTAAFSELCGEMQNGGVDTLLVLNSNPAYDAPADLGFAEALGKVQNKICLSSHLDETAMLCDWHVNAAHYLESWDDARSPDGTYSVVQPLIQPLYHGKTASEIVYLAIGSPAVGCHHLVQKTYIGTFGVQAFETGWSKTLHDGIREGSAFTSVVPALNTDSLVNELRMVGAPAPEFEAVFQADYKVYDGRFANNGWLQEFPEPISKLAWDNAALVSIGDAKRLGVSHGDLLNLTVEGRTIEIPAYLMPGQADGSICLKLGYGRTHAGSVGSGVGKSAYIIRGASGMAFAPAEIAKGNGKYKLVSTQDHHLIDEIGFAERERRVGALVRQGTLAQSQDPEYFSHMVHIPGKAPLWEEKDFSKSKHRWAMAIDLSACNGCGACVLACQSENNIPVVGRKHVGEGREMHWIRIDRYFSGDPENARVVNQPVTCHHCEMAPCEQVCPVAATVHTEEGLNDMVYNRCVGTRYCSNNCPYKVRRFNYFNYRKQMSETEKLLQNPEVTVRSRGVMEKCSFCVQRIQSAKIQAKNAGEAVKDGDVIPACAQTCPSQAITFGDLNDPESAVSKQYANNRSYFLLEELNTKPRISYLGKLTNPQGQAPAGGNEETEHH